MGKKDNNARVVQGPREGQEVGCPEEINARVVQGPREGQEVGCPEEID